MTEKQFKQAAKYVTLFLIVGLVIRLVPIPFREIFIYLFIEAKIDSGIATLIAGLVGFGGLIAVTILNGIFARKAIESTRNDTKSENIAILYADYTKNVIIALNANVQITQFSGKTSELGNVIDILEQINFSGAKDPIFYKGLSVPTIGRVGLSIASKIEVCGEIRREAENWRNVADTYGTQPSQRIGLTITSVMDKINKLFVNLEEDKKFLVDTYSELSMKK